MKVKSQINLFAIHNKFFILGNFFNHVCVAIIRQNTKINYIGEVIIAFLYSPFIRNL